LNEPWIQDLIAGDPSVLGLGDDLTLKGKERTEVGGGKLDLLFEDIDQTALYEVEVQLGATDPSHIIRTIEYWDLERTRYPKREHFAVLVAEDITSRFLNVISLLNKSVPLIAIQMQALEVGGVFTVVFTTVVDLSVREEDEEDIQSAVDRAYWEQQLGMTRMAMLDDVFATAKATDPAFSMKYNQSYIGVAKSGQNFLAIKPRKTGLWLKVICAQSSDIENLIEDLGFGPAKYKKGAYRFNVDKATLDTHADGVKQLIGMAYAGGSW
jgi:hypothetical protein